MVSLPGDAVRPQQHSSPWLFPSSFSLPPLPNLFLYLLLIPVKQYKNTKITLPGILLRGWLCIGTLCTLSLCTLVCFPHPISVVWGQNLCFCVFQSCWHFANAQQQSLGMMGCVLLLQVKPASGWTPPNSGKGGCGCLHSPAQPQQAAEHLPGLPAPSCWQSNCCAWELDCCWQGCGTLLGREPGPRRCDTDEIFVFQNKG